MTVVCLQCPVGQRTRAPIVPDLVVHIRDHTEGLERGEHEPVRRVAPGAESTLRRRVVVLMTRLADKRRWLHVHTYIQVSNGPHA